MAQLAKKHDLEEKQESWMNGFASSLLNLFSLYQLTSLVMLL